MSQEDEPAAAGAVEDADPLGSLFDQEGIENLIAHLTQYPGYEGADFQQAALAAVAEQVGFCWRAVACACRF